MTTMSETAYEGWVILELMGHRQLGGYLSEQVVACAAFLRIDVPAPEGDTPSTQFYSAAAVYCITPTTEEIARAVAENRRPAPVERWQLPALQPPQRERDPVAWQRELDRRDFDDEDERRCRRCGCTDDAACDPPCHWVSDDLCSACEFEGEQDRAAREGPDIVDPADLPFD